MELHSQVAIKSDDAELRVDMARGLTGDTPTWVAEMMLVDTTGPVHVGVGFRGLDPSHLRTIAASLLSAAENLETLQDELAVRMRAAEAPTAKPLTEEEIPVKKPKTKGEKAKPTTYADNAHLVNTVSNAIGDTMRKYGFRAAMVDEGWIGTMALAEAALIAIDEQVSLGVQGTEALVEAVRSRLQYIVEAQMPGVLDMMHWPGTEALADTVCGVALRSRQGL